jgi:hypothetical protein
VKGSHVEKKLFGRFIFVTEDTHHTPIEEIGNEKHMNIYIEIPTQFQMM